MQLKCSICYSPIPFIDTSISSNLYICSYCSHEGKISESLNAPTLPPNLEKAESSISFVKIKDTFLYEEEISSEVVAERKATILFRLKIIASLTAAFLIVVLIINDPIPQVFIGGLGLPLFGVALAMVFFERWVISHVRKTYYFNKRHITISALLHYTKEFNTSHLLKIVVVPFENGYALRFVFEKGKHFQLDTWGKDVAKYHAAKEQFDHILNILKHHETDTL